MRTQPLKPFNFSTLEKLLAMQKSILRLTAILFFITAFVVVNSPKQQAHASLGFCNSWPNECIAGSRGFENTYECGASWDACVFFFVD
jgi:hypothetical protein